MPRIQERAISRLLLLCVLLCACADGAPRPPDVVLVDVESLRVDHLSHAGHPRPTAVGLDRLRERATLFTHARASSSDAASSTASLLTGLSPARAGLGGPPGRLDDRHETLAEVLSAAGWHAAGLSHHSGIASDRGFAQGFERFEAATGELAKHPDVGAMVAWLREWIASDPPRPFFLYLKPMNARGPYRVPARYRAELLGRPPSLALPFDGDLARAARMPGRWRARREIREVHVRSLVEQYDTAVRYTLDRVGEMLSLLERAELFEDALVVVTSNHGEELFDHEGFGSGHTLHEELLRVPLYVKLPRGDAPARVDAPVSLEDVTPTLLELLDLASSAGTPARPTDGISLAPLLRGETTEPPERDFLHVLDATDPRVEERALLRGRYKLIDARRRADGTRNRSLLYDLALDPAEQEDIAPESRELVSELRAALERRLP